MACQEYRDAAIGALRLSERAAQNQTLLSEIDRKINTACMDMVRVGIPDTVVYAENPNPLVTEAVATFCQAKMGREDKRDAYMDAYVYQIEAMRKSAKLQEGRLNHEGNE